jgi:hypothetical protein
MDGTGTASFSAVLFVAFAIRTHWHLVRQGVC